MTKTYSSDSCSRAAAWWIRLRRLRWTRPHGATGLVALGLGCHLAAGAVRGDLAPYLAVDGDDSDNGPPLVGLYAAGTALNAVLGYRLAQQDSSSSAQQANAARMFRRAAVLQCLLCYYIVRFLPHPVWNRHPTLTRALDTAGAIALPLTIASLAWQPTRGERPAIDAAAAAGAAALLLVAAYPVQLALGGWGLLGMMHGSTEIPDYWTCVQNRYPLQGAAMAAFIYVPATAAFAACILGATLYQRRIVAATTFGAGIAGGAFLSLAATVLSQERHVPHVSTQRVYLPCVEPADGSWEAAVTSALDVSVASRHILHWMGVDVPPPPPPPME